jgi:4'-phosphopantetheinyl transferase
LEPMGPTALLTSAERARGAQLRRQSDQRDFVAAHILVRLCAAAVLGEPASSLMVLQRCEVCGGPHGRPVLVGHEAWHVSLSHSAGVVAAAVAPTPVGVDIERFDPRLGARSMSTLVLTAAEATRVEASADPALDFLRMWVRKESLVKLGVITLDELGQVDVSALALEDRSHGAAVSSFRGLQLIDWVHSEPLAVAAAVSVSPLDLVDLDDL